MADLSNLLGESDLRDSTTWPRLRTAAATWAGAQIAEQIQRTGPALREHLHPDEAVSDRDLLADFEAEP